MSGGQTTNIHRWSHLELSQRQAIIREYFATYDPVTTRDFLSKVRAPRGYGVYASLGPNYQYAVFGRDSIRVALDILVFDKSLVEEIILVLATLQGTGLNMVSEEELGKVHHEFRALRFNDHEVSKAAQLVLRRFSPHWGGSKDRMLYYGSHDATPLFIILVNKYCQLYGVNILDTVIVGADRVRRPLSEHVRRAATWLTDKINASPWQLFEYKRMNPVGLYNQGWQDSDTSYLYSNGTVANADNGIASIELQAYAYDALRAAADIVAINEHEANSWRHLASLVRDNTLDKMWMSDKNCFAMGLGREDDGLIRQIDTLSSNVGLLLDSDFLRLMPHSTAWLYVESVVKMLFSQEFLTPVGLRIRGLSHASLLEFADYHGSLVSWPTQTYYVAKGLRYLGFYRLANLLEDSILHATSQAGEFYEFYFVNASNSAKYHYRQEAPDEPTFHDFAAANIPEPGQAWTISAVLAINNRRSLNRAVSPVIQEIETLENAILEQENVKSIQKIIASNRQSTLVKS